VGRGDEQAAAELHRRFDLGGLGFTQAMDAAQLVDADPGQAGQALEAGEELLAEGDGRGAVDADALRDCSRVSRAKQPSQSRV